MADSGAQDESPNNQVQQPQSQQQLQLQPQQQQQQQPPYPGFPGQMPQPMIMYPLQVVSPGLENLALSGGVYIQQEMDIIEMMVGVEMNSRYQVVNQWGQRIYHAGENTKCMDRMCYGRNRPFKVYFCDMLGYPVVVAERKQTCSMCWWGTGVAGSQVTVSLVATGQQLGTVAQNCSPCNPSYRILDGVGNPVLKITGPSCGSCCSCLMCDATFEVVNADTGDLAGEITKHFQITELISDATAFGLDFDPLMPAELKALLMAAVICIDFSFFEGKSGGNGQMKACMGLRGKERKGIFPCNCTGCCCLSLWIIGLLIVGAIIGSIIYSFKRHADITAEMDKKHQSSTF